VVVGGCLVVAAAAIALPSALFRAPHFYPEHDGNQPAGIALADINRDGHNDLVTVNKGNEVTIRNGHRNGTFGAPRSFPVGAGRDYYGLAVAHVNRDRRPDVVTTDYDDDTITVLLARHGGGFARTSFDPDPAFAGCPADVVAADLNGDGKRDLAVADSCSSRISILLGKGTGDFKPARIATAKLPEGEQLQIVTGRFNGDHKPDLAVASGAQHADVLLNRGNGHFHALAPLDFGASTDTYGIASGHFNGDKLSDLAIAVENFQSPPSPDFMAALTATGGGHFHERDINDGESVNVIGVAIGDLNGDGIADLASVRFDGHDLSILRGRGGGRFASPKIVSGLGGPVTVVDGRADGNRSTDLAVGDDGDSAVAIFRNRRSH